MAGEPSINITSEKKIVKVRKKFSVSFISNGSFFLKKQQKDDL